MKRITTIFVMLVLMALSVSIAGATPTNYGTGFQVANLSGSTANIVMTFYNTNGSIAATVNDTIVSNGSNTYFPLDNPEAVNLPAGFAGSAVISSDQPVAAIVNVVGDNFATGGASATGFNQGATSVSLPLIAKNQVNTYDTWFHVQNAGSANANVTVTYAGTTCTENRTIAPGAAAKFDQAINTCLPNGHVGAATITSSEPVVATVVETSRNNTGLFAYNGFTNPSTEVAVPLVQFNNVGYTSGIQVQNTGNAPTTVTVTYAPAGAGLGTACTETGTVAVGASGTFGLFAFTLNGGTNTDDCTNGQRFVGAATVSADQPLVAIINQTNFTNNASAYGGFNPDSATNSLTMPLLMDRNFGYYTGFNLFNAGDASTTVTCIYSPSTNGATIPNGVFTLSAGQAANELQLNKATQAVYVGSANCTSNGQPIIAVVNQLGASTTVDALFTYEAINK